MNNGDHQSQRITFLINTNVQYFNIANFRASFHNEQAANSRPLEFIKKQLNRE